MRNTAILPILTPIIFALSACQGVQASLPGQAEPPALGAKEIQDQMAETQDPAARLEAVAPGIWVDVRPDGVSLRLSPPLFTRDSVPTFARYVDGINVEAIAQDQGTAETIMQQLRGALASAQLQWSIVQGLTAEQREYLMRNVVEPNLNATTAHTLQR